MDLIGSHAIVTGAAKGIGRGIAVAMTKHGAKPVLTDMDTAGAEETAELIRKEGGTALVLTQDVTDPKYCEEVAERAIAEFGPIDVVVTNAGGSKSVPLIELDVAEWERVNNVNAKGVFLTVKPFLAHMIERKCGKIVNIASMVVKEAIRFFAHYCPSKFAVVGLTQSMAKELAAHNINVNCVCPAVVRTHLCDPLLSQLSENKVITRDVN